MWRSGYFSQTRNYKINKLLKDRFLFGAGKSPIANVFWRPILVIP